MLLHAMPLQEGSWTWSFVEWIEYKVLAPTCDDEHKGSNEWYAIKGFPYEGSLNMGDSPPLWFLYILLLVGKFV